MMGRSIGPTAATGPGTVVATRYLVERELGQGGMATVLEVKDLRTDRKLALKVLKPEIAAHEEAVERFRREGEFLSSLRHPALVTVEAIGTLPDGRLYLAMELLTGETLGERIRRGRMSATDISPVLAGAAVGLDAAHRAGVIHRDLKPDNVFLSQPAGGGPMQVKLLDFGISKIDGRSSLTRTGQVLGTPRYMAPEQLRGENDLDPRVDVYALGVILYEALAGQPAFPAQNPSELIVSILNGRVTPLRAVRPEITADLEAVVMRAMARARDARFASAVELAEAWFDVVHRHDGPLGVRTGVSTSVLGGIGASLLPPPAAEDAMRPATFREFEARLPKLGTEAAGPPLASLASRPGMDTPDATAPAHTPTPVAGTSPRVAAPSPSAQAATVPSPASEARADDVDEAARLEAALAPRSYRGALALVLLLVSAVALGIGIHFLRASRSHGVATGGSAPAPLPSIPLVTLRLPDASVPASALDASVAAVARDASTPHDASVASDAATDASAREVHASAVDAGRRTPTRLPPSDPPAGSGAALLARARAASNAGDPRGCVELATEAIAAGVDASVYRLRGDCYRALGDIPHALRSYQRFCTLAPNSSQIATVRRAAEALGGSCP